MDRVHGKERFPLITWHVGMMCTRWLSSSIAARVPNVSGSMPTNNLQGRTSSHFVLPCAMDASMWDTSEVASLSARVEEADTTSTALSWTASTSTRGTGLANCACAWSFADLRSIGQLFPFYPLWFRRCFPSVLPCHRDGDRFDPGKDRVRPAGDARVPGRGRNPSFSSFCVVSLPLRLGWVRNGVYLRNGV